jgi:tRNA dimethylallyltransferase
LTKGTDFCSSTKDDPLSFKTPENGFGLYFGMNKLLLVVAGPTAVGKTSLCVRLAKELQTEVVSADSRQLYRELNIGTAKPTAEEMQGVPHHFIDSHSITEPVSAGQYEREALKVIGQLFQKKDVVILSGGTGLYINAVCFGLDDVPQADPALRAELMDRRRVWNRCANNSANLTRFMPKPLTCKIRNGLSGRWRLF